MTVAGSSGSKAVYCIFLLALIALTRYLLDETRKEIEKTREEKGTKRRVKYAKPTR
jgi:hypothetical protein